MAPQSAARAGFCLPHCEIVHSHGSFHEAVTVAPQIAPSMTPLRRSSEASDKPFRGEPTMIVPFACRVSSVIELSTEDLCRPNCPRCGNILLVAEQSRFNMRGRIDHGWSCDDCGYEFITSIRLASERDLATS
jgi:predicted RNA-binding Zn-ribbon protein involved in translation (DUF1610 family)